MMKLAELIGSNTEYSLNGDGATAITALTCDSRKVTPGTLFFALRGAAADGHVYIAAAIKAGAAAVVLEDADYAPAGTTWVQVREGRAAMADISARFFGSPTTQLPLIGITGTNGKTTTTYLIESILCASGIEPAVLGTISYRFGNTVLEASHTTPESTELQAAFRRLVDAGARAFVMEVSSHALEQKRVDGCCFDVGVFSNLTRDHLDYHGTMEDYLAAKQRLFAELLRPTAAKPHRRAVVNLDDQYGAAIAASAACPVISYGVDHPADVHVRDWQLSVDGISGTLVTPQGEMAFASGLLGRFNLYNILAAASACIALGVAPEAVRVGLNAPVRVPGRMERVENNRGVTLLVDYAHTGDALQNVLTTLHEVATGRIITVFGCGGDRDNGKRPIMGNIAAKMSDLAVVTSDNPRSEDPALIMEQIKSGIATGLREYRPEELACGFSGKGYVLVENRRDAIRLAIRLSQPGDIVLLAGKGHEDYQIIGTVKHHFDDREEAAEALKEECQHVFL